MTKKNKLSKIMASTLLATAMLFSYAITAFAALGSGDVKEGTETIPPQVTITKMLKMPVHTTTPNASFTFKVEKVGWSPDFVTGEADAGLTGSLASMPEHPHDIVISFTNSDKSPATEPAGGVPTVGNGIKTVVKQSSDYLFSGTNAVSFTKPGLYVYNVTEATGLPQLHSGSDYEDWMYYSSASYRLEVWVLEKADGTGFYIKAIGTKITANIDEFWVEHEGEEGDKIDPTKDDGSTANVEHSEMVFTNIYLKNDGGDNPDPKKSSDTVFTLKKLVGQPGADKTKYFDFSILTSVPEIGVDANHRTVRDYVAYVMEDLGSGPVVVTTTANSASVTANKAIIFEPGTAQTVSLKHGQWLAFVNLEVGTGIAVTEIGKADYTPSYNLTLHNTVVTSNTPGEEGKNLGYPTSSNPASGKYFIGEIANNSTFTNNYKTIAITGIGVDDLPYYVMIGIAVVGLAVYLVTKTRRDAAKQN